MVIQLFENGQTGQIYQIVIIFFFFFWAGDLSLSNHHEKQTFVVQTTVILSIVPHIGKPDSNSPYAVLTSATTS